MLRKKMNIAAGKYPHAYTVKILHERFIFSNKRYYKLFFMDHFSFIVGFFFKCFLDGYWMCRLHTQL